jgi:subtilisin family serine protease
MGNKILAFLFCLFIQIGFAAQSGPRLYKHLDTYGKPGADMIQDEKQVTLVLSYDRFPGSFKGTVLLKRDHFAVVRIPSGSISDLLKDSDLIYAEMPTLAQACLDQSLPQIRIPQVWEQQALSGKGVIVGIIDSGIDIHHPAFRNQDGSTRIHSILDLSIPGVRYGGTLYDRQEINQSLSYATFSHTDQTGHGTHVAGIAAGSGHSGGSAEAYSGIAYESDLVIVKATRDRDGVNFQSSDQLIALAFIDSVANALGQPYVANLSFGGHAGAHDGTAIVERYINSLVGIGRPGKAIVTVAGNDGEDEIHAQVNLSNQNSRQEITFIIDSYVSNVGSANDYVQIDGWYPGTTQISVSVISPSGQTFGPVNSGQVIDKQGNDGAVYIWNGFYEDSGLYYRGVNPFNGDREIYIQLEDKQSTHPPEAGEWTLVVQGGAAQVDFYIANHSFDVEFDQGAVSTGKVSIPGTAENAITVGSYCSKKVWTDIEGHRLTLDTEGTLKQGDLSPFSSSGPTRDNRIKPEIVAPGQIIGSALSGDALPTDNLSIFYSSSDSYPYAFWLADSAYGLSSGTSMAAPHVAGLLALILEKYPEANAMQLKTMLTAAGKSDGFVGATPNSMWGYGKVDAQTVFQIEPGQDPPLQFALQNPYPNPFDRIVRLAFELPISLNEEKVSLEIFNSLGQRVRLLFEGFPGVGSHHYHWDGHDDYGRLLASGVYFIRMNIQNESFVKKVAFLSSH